MQKKTYPDHLKNLKVEEFTTPCVHVLSPENTVQQAGQIMSKNRIRHLPVLDSNKKLLGIVSERDLYSSYKLNSDGKALVQTIMKKKTLLCSFSNKNL